MELAAKARGITFGGTLLDGLQSIAETFARLCKTCEVTGDFPAAISAGRESRTTLEMIRSWQLPASPPTPLSDQNVVIGFMYGDEPGSPADGVTSQPQITGTIDQAPKILQPGK